MRKIAMLLAAILMLLPLMSAAAEAEADLPFEWAEREDGTLEITRYTGSGETLTVPERISGKPVTAIGRWAFEDHGELKAVVLPEGITAVGAYAFASCSGLTEVTLPQSLREIGDCAFLLCTALPALTIPAGVKTVGSNPVAYCTVLTDLTVAPGNTALRMDDDGALYAGSRLVACLKAMDRTVFQVPAGTRVIGAYAFAGCKELTAITLPQSLREIREYAFYYCSGLEALTVPAAVTDIDDTAFFWCSRLTLRVTPGSAAERFCLDNGQAFVSDN